jgi:hypothetical protein
MGDTAEQQMQELRRRRAAADGEGGVAGGAAGGAAASAAGGSREGASAAAEAPAAPLSVLERLGRLLQSQEVQLVMVFAVTVDLCSGTYQLYAAARGWRSPLLSLLEYQSGLALLLFASELALLLAAFRGALFSSLGYSLDIVLVGGMFYAALASPGGEQLSRDELAMVPASRVLNALRLWRVARMVSAAIASAEATGAETRAAQLAAEERAEGLRLRARKAEQAHKREVDKYRRLEQSFRAQRDELDTMREALQIAAQTMARVQGFDAIAAGLMGEEERKELDQVVAEQRAEERGGPPARGARSSAAAAATPVPRRGGRSSDDEDELGDDSDGLEDPAGDDAAEERAERAQPQQPKTPATATRLKAS